MIASSTYPLDMIAARRIARRAKARLVFEVHDLWPLSPIELGGMSPRHPFIRLMQWAEDYAYRRADRVVSMLPNAAGHMEAHGMAPEKFRYVPNGFVASEWQEGRTPIPLDHRTILTSLRERGLFLVGYCGAHGLANALESLVEAGSLLRDHQVALVLVGQGPEKATLQRKAEQARLTDVHFLPPVPKVCIPVLLDLLDALFIGLKRTPIFRFGISPNKLIDYMMAGKPVIQAIEAGNDLVAESGCGLSIPPENPQAIADATLRLMALSPAEREAMGLRGREYVLAYHDYRVLAREFLDAMRPATVSGLNDEIQAVRQRYARRAGHPEVARYYDPLDQYVCLATQERERALVRCLRHSGLALLAERRALEVGCGSGGNLLELIRLGFRPSNLVGNELLEDRLVQARERLPAAVTLLCGDAAALDLPDESFDVVLQSTVFTSILDDAFQERLAAAHVGAGPARRGRAVV